MVRRLGTTTMKAKITRAVNALPAGAAARVARDKIAFLRTVLGGWSQGADAYLSPRLAQRIRDDRADPGIPECLLPRDQREQLIEEASNGFQD